MKIHFKESIIFSCKLKMKMLNCIQAQKKGKTMTEWITAYLISFAITATCFALTILAARDWYNVRDNDTLSRMGFLAAFTFFTIFPMVYILTH